MNKILKTLKRKWAEYLLEVLVVTIGILGAYMLNNWNEERKDRIREIQLLTELHADLIEMEAEFTNDIRYARQSIRSKEVIIEVIENELPYQDSLQQYFNNFFWIQHTGLIKSTYSSIENWGINNLSNDSLRRQIVSLFQTDNDYLDALTKSQWNTFYGPYQDLLGLLFDLSNTNEVKVMDYDLLITSKEHAKRERTMLGASRLTVNGRAEVLGRISQLKENVELEIERLSK